MTSHHDLTRAAALATSADWRDRAEADRLVRQVEVTLPDQFPCIYETPDSPRQQGMKARPFAWVLSPDVDLLNALLPDYQELWDCYTAQWGPGSRRTLAVGLLDGLSPRGVLEPGTTVEQVIGQTMMTHTGMYQWAPERLRKMHPMHEQWTAARAARGF